MPWLSLLWRSPLRRILLLALCTGLAALVIWGLCSEDALARVGGGQTSRGSRSSSGGSSYSSGSGGEADILFFLLYLAIEVPIIGVPLLLLFVGFLVVRGLASARKGGGVQVSTHGPGPRAVPRSPRRGASRRKERAGLPALRKVDSGFSLPVLEDFIQLLHRRATRAAVRGEWDALRPFVAEGARRSLQAAHQGVEDLDDLVLGGIALRSVMVGPRVRLVVALKGTRRETRKGSTRRVHVEEEWTLERDREARSLPPEDMLRMGCPSCASAVDTDPMGRCRSCETPITRGQLQWQVTGVRIGQRQPYAAPEVSRIKGGDEPSVHDPTRLDPRLGQEMRGLIARHEDFDWRSFQRHVAEVYTALQTAWSQGRWEQARPFVTDPMYQTLRFYMERYSEHGLRNRLEDVELLKQQVVKIEVDAWYEAITVRLWGSMKDSVIRVETGEVIGGNPSTSRRFSEYWTFLRAAGTGGSSSDARHCPSCGAPLDNISQAGVCGYCDSKITTGQFDWVLSRIHQTAEYEG